MLRAKSLTTVGIYTVMLCLLAGAAFGMTRLDAISLKVAIVWLFFSILLVVALFFGLKYSPPLAKQNWRGMTEQSYVGFATAIAIMATVAVTSSLVKTVQAQSKTGLSSHGAVNTSASEIDEHAR